MPYLYERARWTRQPPPGLRGLDSTGWWNANLRSAILVDNAAPWELVRGVRVAVSTITGRSNRARNGPRVGNYTTLAQTNTVTWSHSFGTTGLSASSSLTLMAILTGSARTTLTVRAQVSNTLAGNSYPAILEGDGTNNYWGARVRIVGGTDVTAWSTKTAPADGQARVLVARYTNGVGIDLFLDGELVASAATTANLFTTPSILQPMSGVANVDPAPLAAVWTYAMPDHLIQALSLNPWQMLRPQPRLSWFDVSSTQTYSYTASGGLVLAGASPALRTAARAADGGLLLSGAAPAVRERVAAPAGGILFSGAADYSTSTGSNTYTYTASGGVQFGGSSGQTREAVRAAAGGAQFGGAAVVSTTGLQTLEVFPTGGMVFSGAAPAARARAAVGFGGVLFSGIAGYETRESERVVTATGGIVFAGSADRIVPSDVVGTRKGVWGRYGILDIRRGKAGI